MQRSLRINQRRERGLERSVPTAFSDGTMDFRSLGGNQAWSAYSVAEACLIGADGGSRTRGVSMCRILSAMRLVLSAPHRHIVTHISTLKLRLGSELATTQHSRCFHHTRRKKRIQQLGSNVCGK